MKKPSINQLWPLLASAVAALIVAACKTAPVPAPQAPTPQVATPPASPVAPSVSPQAPRLTSSIASTPRAYRRDAATHLYQLNSSRVFKGQLPPQLYAVGVLEVDIDSRGNVSGTHWMRAPSHAPEVMAEILRTVRSAAPYPVPTRMGKVTYTDTWLWDRSGQFQLDTLTEGQL